MDADPLLALRLTRRGFLVVGAMAGLAACGDGGGRRSAPARPRPRPRVAPTVEAVAPPFALGVASGDPLADRVVLWTRLFPPPASDVDVDWEVATDDRLRRVVRRGSVGARAGAAHTVHVDVDGLDPNRWYWYRFRAAGEISPVGRTRTWPADGSSPRELRFAFASCQSWQDGYYAAYRHLAGEDLDLVVHLGDYIYEDPPDPKGVRQHDGPEPVDLDGYRRRYALYKSDPQLQAAHAAFPWILTADDHEVQNNYAGDVSNVGLPPGPFRARRAAAYRAYYEHQPLRASPPNGPNLQLFRRSTFGDLAELHVLDTRQFRSNQPCGQSPLDVGERCAEALASTQTMTGAEQESWLFDGLRRSRARWNVIANQTVLSEFAIGFGGTKLFNLDQWDGYVAARQRLLDFLARTKPSNPVVITGDIHSSAVSDVKANFDDPGSATIATEFVGTSITSSFFSSFLPLVEASLREHPYVHYFDGRGHGYVRCTVGRDHWRADYRTVSSVTDPNATIATARSFAVESGKAGAVRA